MLLKALFFVILLLFFPGTALAAETPLQKGLRTPEGAKPIGKQIQIGPGKRLLLRFPAGSARALVISSEAASGVFVRQAQARWKRGLPRRVWNRQNLQSDLRFSEEIRLEVSGRTFEIGSSSKTILSHLPYLQGVPVTRAVAVGDIACSSADSAWNDGLGTATECRGSDTLAEATGAEAALLLGDLQYPTGTLSQFEEGFAGLWGSWPGDLYPIPGNHEYYTPGAAGYFEYFAGTPSGRRSFRLGDWTVFALDSNCDFISCSEQTAWLEEELSKEESRCTLAFWHHPVLSSGIHGNNAEMLPAWQSFVRGGGDVVLQGHDHHYQRFVSLDENLQPASRGAISWVVGTGGKSLRETITTDSRTAFLNDTRYGLLRLDLRPQSYSWSWGEDSGQATCSL